MAVAFESADPYADFRASTEEMLGWYLRANDVDTHCAIVADRSKCPTGSGAGDHRRKKREKIHVFFSPKTHVCCIAFLKLNPIFICF